MLSSSRWIINTKMTLSIVFLANSTYVYTFVSEVIYGDETETILCLTWCVMNISRIKAMWNFERNIKFLNCDIFMWFVIVFWLTRLFVYLFWKRLLLVIEGLELFWIDYCYYILFVVTKSRSNDWKMIKRSIKVARHLLITLN